jgi:hypothetical protein
MPVFPADAGKSGMREGGKIRGLPRLGNLTSILTFLLFYAFAHAPCRGLCFVFFFLWLDYMSIFAQRVIFQ